MKTGKTLTENALAIETQTFAELGVVPEIVEALSEKGIEYPFPIQALAIPIALAGTDMIGQARTGTGKTLAFGISLLQRVTVPSDPKFEDLAAPGKPQALVMCPTRELALQVAGDLQVASAVRKARVLTVYGGVGYEVQLEALEKGVEVVVGTPGRLLDLANRRTLDLSHVRVLVLDEADEMLDLGFLPDVEKLLSATPASRHTMLFSATMPGAVVALARRYMTQPTHIRAADPDDDGATVKAIAQFVYRAHALDKVEVLARILQSQGRGLTIVFARTKRTAAKVAEEAPVGDLFKEPLHPYTQGLLRSIPRIYLAATSRRRLETIPGTVPTLRGDIAPGCRFAPRCPFVKSVCTEKDPVLKEVKPGHKVSCWLY